MTKKTKKKKEDTVVNGFNLKDIAKNPLLYILLAVFGTSGFDLNSSANIQGLLEEQGVAIVETRLAVGALEGQIDLIADDIGDNSDSIAEHEGELDQHGDDIIEIRFLVQDLVHAIEVATDELSDLADDVAEAHTPDE